MWVILFTSKLLIINCTSSSIGQAFTEGCLIKKKKKMALTKGHFGHHGAKGQVLKHPPPSARACSSGFCLKKCCNIVIRSLGGTTDLIIRHLGLICFD